MTKWPISGKTPWRHLDTTRANIEFAGAHAVDLVCAEGLDPASTAPFKGNLDIEKLERCIAEHGKEKIPFGMVTVTNNNGAETPAPLELVRLAFPQFLRHFTCHFEVVDE